ncbi:MAG: alpha-L-rhamnosidase-related protein [Minisyncoccota bacterium]
MTIEGGPKDTKGEETHPKDEFRPPKEKEPRLINVGIDREACGTGESEEIEKFHQKMVETYGEDPEWEDKMDLIKSLRLRRLGTPSPVFLETENRERVEHMAEEQAQKLKNNYEPGFGIFPSANPDENFYGQVWTRDFAHAGGNFFAKQNPKALKDSLETVFSHQREDGALPLRIEKQYLLLKLIPGLRNLAKPVFNLIENKVRGRKERPVYEGQDFSSAEDTVPAALIAAGEFFISSSEGKEFIGKHFNDLKKAVDYFRTKVDPADGLVSARRMNADWADSINRGGKLGGMNVYWARSLRLMSFMSSQLERKEDAALYKEEFRRTKRSVMEKLYDKEGAYFHAEEGTDRVDTVASIFGSLYLLSPEECARVQETFKKRMKKNSGLKNFDPPYPSSQIIWPHKLIGHEGYHNTYVWPWVTCENIQVKIKIALGHPDQEIRGQYKKEAVEDLLDMANLFKDSNGAYEIYQPDTRRPAITKLYKPPQNLMANLAAYEGAYTQLKELGWI